MTAASDHIRIEALIRRWVKAVREGNRTAIRADHDAELLLFDGVTPQVCRGLDAYMQTWETFFRAWHELQSFECSDLRITNGLDVAFATGLGKCAGIATNGRVESMEFHLTLGLRKVDGRWRVMHEHHSLPAATVTQPLAGTAAGPRHPVPTLDRPVGPR